MFCLKKKNIRQTIWLHCKRRALSLSTVQLNKTQYGQVLLQLILLIKDLL
jgi:hypothetical protein